MSTLPSFMCEWEVKHVIPHTPEHVEIHYKDGSCLHYLWDSQKEQWVEQVKVLTKQCK